MFGGGAGGPASGLPPAIGVWRRVVDGCGEFDCDYWFGTADSHPLAWPWHRGTEHGKAKSKCRGIHIDMRDGRDGRRIGLDFRLRGNDEGW